MIVTDSNITQSLPLVIYVTWRKLTTNVCNRYTVDDDSSATSCLITYSATCSFPEMGQLVRGRSDEVVRNHTGDCHNFLFESFKYRFSGTASVSVDYLPLTVELDDGRRPPVRESVFVKVTVRGGVPNSTPVLRVNVTQVPVVRQLTTLRFDLVLLVEQFSYRNWFISVSNSIWETN